MIIFKTKKHLFEDLGEYVCGNNAYCVVYNKLRKSLYFCSLSTKVKRIVIIDISEDNFIKYRQTIVSTFNDIIGKYDNIDDYTRHFATNFMNNACKR